MKKAMRFVSVILAIGMLAGSLAGCGKTGDDRSSGESSDSSKPGNASSTSETGTDSNFNETGFPIVSEKVIQKITCSADPSINVGPDMYVFAELEKKTNVNFEFEKLSPDQWNEKKNLMFASNELPDILVGSLSNGDIITYSKANQLIPLNDLFDKYAPDYMQCLSNHKESAKLYAPDGNMYGMVGVFTGGSAETPGARAFINKAWLDKLGMDMPKTYDDFYAMLVAFRDQDPGGNGAGNTIPVSGMAASYTPDCFVAGPLGMSFGNKKDTWQMVGDKLVFYAEHPQYKRYLTNMNQLYEEKLLDQEYYTQNDAQIKAKGENMLIGAYTYSAHFLMTNSTDPAVYDQYVVPEPIIGDEFTEKAWYGDAVNSMTIFITSANQNPEISIRYLNEFYTEEGADLICGPFEGEWDGEGGRVWNGDKTKFTYDVPEGFTGIWDWMCKEVSCVGIGIQGYMQFSEIKAKEQKSPEDASFKDQMEQKVAPYLNPSSPTLFFSAEELEEIKLMETDINTYAEQMEAKIIMGEEPLEAYDALLASLKERGIEKVTEIYNQAYGRYKANM